MVNPLYNATPETPSKAATDLISTENFQVSIISKQNFYTVSDWVVSICQNHTITYHYYQLYLTPGQFLQ